MTSDSDDGTAVEDRDASLDLVDAKPIGASKPVDLPLPHPTAPSSQPPRNIFSKLAKACKRRFEKVRAGFRAVTGRNRRVVPASQ